MQAVAKRYKEKLELYCDNIDPYVLHLIKSLQPSNDESFHFSLNLDPSNCSRDPQDLPDITTHHIVSYLMLTKCPYTGEKKGEKTIELDNGTVLQICVQKLDAISIVLGEILLETGEYLKPWFVCFPCGYVLCAHCTLCHYDETCKHVGLLLYSVNKVKVNEGMLDSNVSATNQIDTIDLTDGEQIDKPSRLYVCGICSDQFENKEDFKEHCNVMHQLHQIVPVEPQTVRRKRKNRNEDNSYVCASNSQIQIVNAESIEMYHDNEMSSAPEFVDAEHLICDEANVEYGPIVIFNQNEMIGDNTNVVNLDQNSELIVIEDEDD
ncbi:hypothetical protein Bhyg_09975 [Pseudolycoriella hygida]|uniref:C2H2-type domain-containing protein n=1 Tax=Pseudolycoriella hygida TaxID=35572 RepID=A0A9Q0RWY5_9DIPT|nr:hypothetical protein Bhyg_09975 [Pseudolycoriella hygida]